MKLFFLLSMLFAAEAYAQALNSYVAPTRVLRAKGYQIGVYNDYFVSSDQVDEKGKVVEDDTENFKFNRFQTEIQGYYGATNELQFGVGARFRQNAGSFDLNNETVNMQSSGLQSTFVNFQFAFAQVDQMQYTLEGMFRYITYTNNESEVDVNNPTREALEKDVILGDTGNEFSVGMGVTYLAKNNNFFTLRGGYRKPGSDISDEIYWQVEGAMAWKHIALLAGVDGVSSLKNDPYEDKPDEIPVYNSPTSLYHSTNREWITPYAGINIGLGDTWRVELKGSQTVSGKSTDLGTTFGINLIRRVDKSATRLVDNKFKTYDLEATVTKVSPKKEYVVIDKGIADDFNKGMRVDFFEFDYVGGNVLVATGVIVQTKADTSIVKITQRYNMKKEIKEGLIARTSLK